MKFFCVFWFFCILLTNAEELLVYEGDKGPGKGKHIVFLASDHEYRSEESCPAIARILAKHHGFKCTVLFGVNDDGTIRPGSSKIPGMSKIAEADMLFVFARFLHPSDRDMKYFDDYIRKGGPVMGLRTSTHAFNMKGSKFQRYHFRFNEDGYNGGFGRQVLGETWAGHYGRNHKCSTRIMPEDTQKAHPVLTGVGPMHVQSGGYVAKPMPNSEILAQAIVLETMNKDSKPLSGKEPQAGIWVRTYKGDEGQEGRVWASTHGASEDIQDVNFRRCIINGVFWTLGMESKIQPDMNVSFVGEYNPITFSFSKYRIGIKPLDIKGWDSPIWSKKAKLGNYGKKRK